jgi:hypothetical protein
LDLTQQFLKGESTQGSTHRLEHGFIELMNFKTCPNCSYRLPVVAAFCSQCGSQLQVPNNDHAKEPAAFWSFAMALIGPIFCLLILALLFWFLMSKEKGHTNSPGILRSFYVRSASVDHSCTTITKLRQSDVRYRKQRIDGWRGSSQDCASHCKMRDV